MTVKKIGLTGGIASGKTTAQRLFENLGVKCIDHDLIAREVVALGTQGLGQLVQHFGKRILKDDGSLSRPQLKKIIFNSAKEKQQVEHIIHPLVFERSEELLQSHRKEPYVLIVSPLLIESGSAKTMHALIVVNVSKELQLQRLLERDGMTKTLAQSIINSQVTQEQRMAAGNYFLRNDGDKEHLRRQVQSCHESLLELELAPD